MANLLSTPSFRHLKYNFPTLFLISVGIIERSFLVQFYQLVYDINGFIYKFRQIGFENDGAVSKNGDLQKHCTHGLPHRLSKILPYHTFSSRYPE